MDPETALEFVKHGATIILLDVPQYTLIGVDTQMFSSGPNFKGIKMIPPGIHFVYYSSSNRKGSEFSPFVGFFIDAKASQGKLEEFCHAAAKADQLKLSCSGNGSFEEHPFNNMLSFVIVRKWDQKEERFVKLSDDEEERYSDAVKGLEFDKHLGPYTLSQYGVWRQLSNYITKNTIERIAAEFVKLIHYREGLVNSVNELVEPIGGEITVAFESEMVGISKTAMEEALADQFKNSKFSSPVEKPQKSCYYTAIPRVVKHKGMSGKELTDLNLDKTQLLESILIKEYRGDEDAVLAELQFAFIAFLMGQSLEAFMQWKLLVSLLLGCTEAPLHTRSRLFTKFIEVIYYQLKYVFVKDQKDIGAKHEGESVLLDESWLSSDNFLHRLCKVWDFFSVVLAAQMIDGDLLSWTRRLRVLLEESLGWQFQMNSAGDEIYVEEDDEYAPVVEIVDDADFSTT
ncbi:hypothetical protein OROMI_000814 [Orobanche minor]